MQRLLNKHFGVFIYFLYFAILMTILYQLRTHLLLPMPEPGTDQRAMLSAAAALSRGKLWPQTYLYSPIYTSFLAVLVLLSKGEILVMRILQAALCALIPLVIYKTARSLRVPFLFSQIGALLYCFYAASALISLDFLRAAPLSLVFISYFYFLVRAYKKKKTKYFILAGICAAFSVLGRENFILVIVIPFFFLAFKSIRMQVKNKQVLICVLSSVLPIFLVCMINFLRFGKFSILPGNAVNVIGFYYQGYEISPTNLKLLRAIAFRVFENAFKYISSYEIPNSLSVYAHKDFSYMLEILFLPFNAILFGALLLPFIRVKKDTLLLTTLGLAYFLSMLIFEPFYRFRIPVVPFLFVMCAITIYEMSKMRLWRIVIVVLVWGIATILTYQDPQLKRTTQEKIATIEALLNQGLIAIAEKRIFELEKEGIDVHVLLKKYLKNFKDSDINTKY